MNEEKDVQPKFEVRHLGDSFPEYPMLEELKYWCARFQKSGLTPSCGKGTLGNLSFRLEKGGDEFVITASAVGFKDGLSSKDFVQVSSVDTVKMLVNARGSRLPSSESMLHSAIYKARQDVNAIFHGHCRKILDNAPFLGIPQTKNEESYGSRALVDSVIEVLDNKSFLIMKDHGFLSLGDSMKTAGENAMEIYLKCSG